MLSNISVQIDLFNYSNQSTPLDIFFFQKSTTSAYWTVWKVIRQLSPGNHHPFSFPYALQLDCANSHQSFTALQDAPLGTAWEVTGSSKQMVLQRSNKLVDPTSIMVTNGLASGAVDVNFYRGDPLVLNFESVAPQLSVLWSPDSNLWATFSGDYQPMQQVDAQTLAQGAIQLNLSGLSKVSLACTGGGNGADTQPLGISFLEFAHY